MMWPNKQSNLTTSTTNVCSSKYNRIDFFWKICISNFCFNLIERKNPHTPVYGVKEFVCLSVHLWQTLTPIISGLAEQNGLKKVCNFGCQSYFDFERLSFNFLLILVRCGGKSYFSIRKSISTIKRRAENPFAGQNTQHCGEKKIKKSLPRKTTKH